MHSNDDKLDRAETVAVSLLLFIINHKDVPDPRRKRIVESEYEPVVSLVTHRLKTIRFAVWILKGRIPPLMGFGISTCQSKHCAILDM